MVNIRKFTGVVFRNAGRSWSTATCSRAPVAAFLKACVRSRLLDRLRRRARARARRRCCRAARPSSTPAAGRDRRGGVRGDIPLPNVATHADPGRPPRAAGGRPPPAGRRLPAHGARRRHRRRGPRPRGPAPAAHAVVGRQGLHHHPRRLGPPGPRPGCGSSASSPTPTSRCRALNSLVSEAIDVVVHCARTADGPRVTEVIAVEDLAGGPDGHQFTVTEVFRRAGLDAPLRWTGAGPAAARAPAPRRRVRRPGRSTSPARRDPPADRLGGPA